MRIQAREGSCPEVEILVDWVADRLDGERSELLALHTRGCRRCQAEAKLARTCLSAADSEYGDERTLFVLERTGEVIDRLVTVPRVSRIPRLWPVAAGVAAAVLVFALDPFGSRPSLDIPEAGSGATRGGRVMIVGPEGTLEAGLVSGPLELRWRAYEGATGYRVTIRDVTKSVVHEARTTGTRLILDKNTPVFPSVRYTWRVEALDGQEEVLGVSRPVDLLLPAEEPDTNPPVEKSPTVVEQEGGSR